VDPAGRFPDIPTIRNFKNGWDIIFFRGRKGDAEKGTFVDPVTQTIIWFDVAIYVIPDNGIYLFRVSADLHAQEIPNSRLPWQENQANQQNWRGGGGPGYGPPDSFI